MQRLIVSKLGNSLTRKSAGVGALLVLLAMMALAVNASLRNGRAIETARGAARQVLVLHRAQRAVSGEEDAMADLRPASAPRTRRAFDRASHAARRSLLHAVDAALAPPVLRSRVLLAQIWPHQTGNKVIFAARFGRAGEARRLSLSAFVPQAEALHRMLDEVDESQVRYADQTLRALETRNEALLTAMPFALVLGALLLGLLWLVALEARRREAATSAQLELVGRQAMTDSLTGAGNHRAFQEDLTRLLGGGCPHPRVGLVVLDLVGLKQVNDTRGHQAGDERLTLFAGCAQAAISEGGLYRIGGDEFALVLPGAGAWAAFNFVESLKGQLRDCSEPDVLEVKAGVAEAAVGTDRDGLYREANLALVAARASNRGTIVYSPDLEPRHDPAASEAEQRHKETLATALASAVDAKDSYTRSHCETVSALCGLIAEKLGLAPRRIAALRLAGLLHDVGKIGIADDILQKPSRLTEAEFEVMKTHVEIGHGIVMAAGLEQKAEWVLHHHERPDGNGYPDGLSGEEIPLESRIILVADAFEAITSDRRYRAGRPASEALAELDRHAGSQFDPNCVSALRRILERDTVDLDRAALSGRPPLAAATV